MKKALNVYYVKTERVKFYLARKKNVKLDLWSRQFVAITEHWTWKELAFTGTSSMWPVLHSFLNRAILTTSPGPPYFFLKIIEVQTKSRKKDLKVRISLKRSPENFYSAASLKISFQIKSTNHFTLLITWNRIIILHSTKPMIHIKAESTFKQSTKYLVYSEYKWQHRWSIKRW